MGGGGYRTADRDHIYIYIYIYMQIHTNMCLGERTCLFGVIRDGHGPFELRHTLQGFISIRNEFWPWHATFFFFDSCSHLEVSPHGSHCLLLF